MITTSQAKSQTNHQEKKSSKAKLLIVDPAINPKQLENEFAIERPEVRKSSLPSLELRDKIFEGINKISDWDETEKDLLYVRIKSRNMKEIKKIYPELSSEEIKKMKERMGE